MLDLGKINEKLYLIKLEDGTILKIRKPSQALLAKMTQLQHYDTTDYSEEVMDNLVEIATDIFNRNTKGIQFTKNEISGMLDLEVIAYLIKDYIEEVYGELGK